MVRSILVALDGSDVSEHALPVALSVARRLGASLEIVHVHVPLPVEHPAAASPHHLVLNQAMRDRGREYLDSVAARLSAVKDVPLTTTLLEGPVAEAIDQHVMATNVDLLVLTTHGPGPLGRYWLGSVADALVRQVTRPVLLVPPYPEAPELNRHVELREFLVPLDGSQRAEQILEPALALVDKDGGRFTLLRVVTPMLPNYPPRQIRIDGPVFDELETLHRQECEGVQTELEQVAQRLRGGSVQAETLVVAHGQPATAIVEQATARGADLIALATQGRGGFKRLLLGSVASKVLRHAAIPVLMYRPTEPDDTDPS
jgi:nucleotide-binding universal stress UspA family protein